MSTCMTSFKIWHCLTFDPYLTCDPKVVPLVCVTWECNRENTFKSWHICPQLNIWFSVLKPIQWKTNCKIKEIRLCVKLTKSLFSIQMTWFNRSYWSFINAMDVKVGPYSIKRLFKRQYLSSIFDFQLNWISFVAFVWVYFTYFTIFYW